MGGRYGLEGSSVAVVVLGLATVALTRWKGLPLPETASPGAPALGVAGLPSGGAAVG
ncbi:hypothetical protein OV207_31030 [Corallococcus sp. BB11-1]|uniref:hypothetical protein n=1 Tax=Corallococcus sp. BB11-1 TaxID=2996783 RepID=UPI002270C992|nr:hypothetical protein [Corallococcus sp. BB11-1]MCY1035915.1 hypothetical protein [Corallococcus sp. BB11-1]